MKILLVEDDPYQLEPIKTALTCSRHIVDGVQQGDTAQWLLTQRHYDLLILDWMLPKVSGLDICRQYRACGKTSPVLILTARDSVRDRVAGLDAGADDYLVKPIDVIELLARVRALARRSPVWQGDVLQVADLTLHLSSLTVERGPEAIQLTRREFQLLEYFLRHPRQVLSHNQIENALWEWDFEPESNAVTKLVRRLRQRLEALGAAEWVETIYGMGYRLRPQIEPVTPAASLVNVF
jgi:OmpR-family two-component system manganese-sensing response regulator